MENKIKSGKEIVEDFFTNIKQLPNIDQEIASLFSSLHAEGRLTDTNIKNGLQKIREQNATKN